MFKTLSDIVALLEQMRRSDNKQLASHAETLVGPRQRGSTTELGLHDLLGVRSLSGISLEEVTDKIDKSVKTPGCRYYKAYCPEAKGMMAWIGVALCVMLGAIPLSKAHEIGIVYVRSGLHGPELVVCAGELPNNFSAKCDDLYFTIGPENEYEGFPNGVLYTWHPGAPLAFLSPETGVKIVLV